MKRREAEETGQNKESNNKQGKESAEEATTERKNKSLTQAPDRTTTAELEKTMGEAKLKKEKDPKISFNDAEKRLCQNSQIDKISQEIEVRHTETTSVEKSKIDNKGNSNESSVNAEETQIRTTEITNRNIAFLGSTGPEQETAIVSSSIGSVSSPNNMTSHRPSVLDKVVNDEQLKTVSSSLRLQADSAKFGVREKLGGDLRNISFIEVKKETKFIKKKKISETVSGVHSANLRTPREVSGKKEHISPALTGDNPPCCSNVREIITTDIPQSLSTDSGIGSPLEIRTSIDPGVGHDTESGQDGNGKEESNPASSLAPGVVPSSSNDRLENCRSCIYKGDSPSLSSRADTSNYQRTSVSTACQSIQADAFSKHDIASDISSAPSEQENFKLECAEDSGKKCASFDNSTSSVTEITQNTESFQEKYTPLQDGYSNTVDSTISTNSVLKNQLALEFKENTRAHDSDNCKRTSVIHTIQTAEFTVEYERANSDRKNTELGTISFNGENREHADFQSGTSPDITASVIEQTLESRTKFNITAEAACQISTNFEEVSVPETGSPFDNPAQERKIKGILKTTSAPSLGDKRDRGVTLTEGYNLVTPAENQSPRSVSFNKIHTKNTFSYNNIAFEGEIITEPSKRPSLAEVVSNMMRHSSVIETDEDNCHPYGRDCSLTDLMTGKRRDNYHLDAGKMIVWLALAIMIVSLAGGIIFMSETYNMSHRDQTIELPDLDTTTLNPAH